MKLTLKYLMESNTTTPVDGYGWVPARPMDCRTLRERVHESWLVFIGQADAFIWPQDEVADKSTKETDA